MPSEPPLGGPDVILVGEMRDLETIQLAISAAETGHLVFGTLHIPIRLLTGWWMCFARAATDPRPAV